MSPLRSPARSLRLVVTLLFALSLPACAALEEISRNLLSSPSGRPRVDPPRVSVQDVRLVEAPRLETLGAYFCTRVAPPFLCALFGAVPNPSDFRFAFDLQLDFANPNAFPVPLVEVLAAFTAYPDLSGARNLGAVCVDLTDGTSGGGCRSSSSDIRGIEDFAVASARFLFALATGTEHIENVRVRTLAAQGSTRLTLRLRLDAGLFLELVQRASQDAVAAAQRGQSFGLVIPFRVEGSVWLNVDHFGRFALSLPAFRGSWDLARTAASLATPR